MSGMASATRSPSSFSTRRNVVWVAGCCGPKFIVHKYGCPPSWAWSSASSESVRGMGEGVEWWGLKE